MNSQRSTYKMKIKNRYNIDKTYINIYNNYYSSFPQHINNCLRNFGKNAWATGQAHW